MSARQGLKQLPGIRGLAAVKEKQPAAGLRGLRLAAGCVRGENSGLCAASGTGFSCGGYLSGSESRSGKDPVLIDPEDALQEGDGIRYGFLHETGMKIQVPNGF